MQETYREYKCQVIHEGNLTESLKVHSGVQQGCILSPTLFLIVMDDIMRRVGLRDGVCMEGQRIWTTQMMSASFNRGIIKTCPRKNVTDRQQQLD
jgi:hypothetical protein